jgi:signal transduction histidine kinase
VARAEAVHLLHDQAELLNSGLAELAEPVARLERSAARLARLAGQADQTPVPADLERHLQRLARVVAARAQVVRRTMEHLQDATGIQTDSLELGAERVNLVPLIARVVASAKARSSAHKFNVALPQGLTALVDPVRMVHVVEALLGQAMHRNPRGCYIDVDLRRPLVGLAQLEVRDYGRAVSAEDQRRLLETNGPSFGLSVSRWIVEQQGGTLTLEAPPERGLRAIVTLPTQRGRVSGV